MLFIFVYVQEIMDVNYLMMIKIIINGKELKVSLEDSFVVCDFVVLLLFFFMLEDYVSIEKVVDLLKWLNIDSVLVGIFVKVGDIIYYVFWGNLAIFYKDFWYVFGLVKLGYMEGDWSVLFGLGKLEVELLIEL